MTSITFEEARRCPKCDQPGQVQEKEERTIVANDGKRATVRVVRCMNKRCRWFDTDWIIQVNDDGTVPVREGHQPKAYPSLPGMTTERAQEQADDRRRS